MAVARGKRHSWAYNVKVLRTDRPYLAAGELFQLKDIPGTYRVVIGEVSHNCEKCALSEICLNIQRPQCSAAFREDRKGVHFERIE